MASEVKKLDRVHTISTEDVPQKMWSLPIEELFFGRPDNF